MPTKSPQEPDDLVYGKGTEQTEHKCGGKEYHTEMPDRSFDIGSGTARGLRFGQYFKHYGVIKDDCHKIQYSSCALFQYSDAS
ncbi:uncharacterized protein KY384_002262 [Bacidia gigantensis]|uniref:uncharacterized protein n=1 Tax=Bacidia gigantensis TaxID=2732470 RepID=UPI001D047C8E|nr:uncharacterized protein KY384_002262 [Bacidia gigantensis]KAG8533479.1 hypothetical protein KY384_002262 [Bacidia gigantensis]